MCYNRLVAYLSCSRSRWLHQFVDLQGISVLATTLSNINRKGPNRKEADTNLEYEILKCLRITLNQEV